VAGHTQSNDGFSKLLVSYRIRAGLTQEDLAARSGLSVRALSDMERGRTARPYKASVERLADALELSGSVRLDFIGAARSQPAILPAATGPPSAASIEPGGLNHADDDLPTSVTVEALPVPLLLRRLPLVPRQLPATAPYFAGRDDELTAMAALLDRTHDLPGAPVTVMVINGTAGVGKTALALHWAHQATDQFPDGQLYLDMRGFDPSGRPVTPAEAIRAFLDALGVPVERIPADMDAQTALYRSLLAGKRMLVVLDNVHDAAQVRPLLPGSPGCRVVVTSRSRLTGLVVSVGARQINLDVLSEASACDLLSLHLGTERLSSEPQAVRRLTELTARLPLALAIAAAHAAARPGFPLAAITSELLGTLGRLDALDSGDAATSVRAVFSWSYQNLTAPTARMFRLLGIHPGPDITVAAAASLAAVPVPQAHEALSELAQAHLLTEHPPGRFAFHDLLRAYAAEQARLADGDAERHQAILRTLDHYLHTAYEADQLLGPVRRPLTLAAPEPGTTPEHHSGIGGALVWLAAEKKVLLAAISLAAEAGSDRHAWQLPRVTATFFDRQGHWRELAATQRGALAAAQRMGDLDGQAGAHRSLADACIQLGLREDTRSHLRDALDLYQQLDDRNGQARTQLDFCRVVSQLGQHDEALIHAKQALELFESVGDQSGQAYALNGTGWLCAQLGDNRRAMDCCRQALKLFREIGEPSGEAATWYTVGYVHQRLGRHAEAVTCYLRALDLYRELGNRFIEAEILARLGDAYQAEDDAQAAGRTWQRALTILTELNHPDADDIREKLNRSVLSSLGLVVGAAGAFSVLAGEDLGAVLIMRLNRVDELGVLGPRAVPADRSDQPVVPLHPAAHGVSQVGEHTVPGHGGDLSVELVVRGDCVAQVIRISGLLPLPPQRAQPCHSGRVRIAGREPGGLHLEQLAHVEQLVYLRVGGDVDEGTLTGAEVHPAFGLHAVQRFPDRLPADPELARDIGLHQVLARR
jgi:tetratricopeptide (TPR) repeat protein/transcriptional regulator with XRE-family HTH domain